MGKNKSSKSRSGRSGHLVQGDPLHQVLPPCFNRKELDDLKSHVDKCHSAAGVTNIHSSQVNQFRRSSVTYMIGDEYKWLYDRLWQVAVESNKKYKFAIREYLEPIQLAIYDGSNRGFFDWHMDITPQQMRRKISISMPLNDDSEYEGGELEMLYSGIPQRVPQKKGTVITFPSFLMHRVAPVTNGSRYSMVAWIGGPDFR